MGHDLGLFVGINRYTIADRLRYAENDAIRMKETFETAVPGGRSFLFTESSPPLNERETLPNRSNLRWMLSDLRLHKGVSSENNVWFFFSGHGMRHDGTDYLLTIDANPNDLAETALPVNYVIAQLSQTKARNIVLILDACRDSMRGARGARAIGPDSATAYAKELGVISLFSCSPTESSWEADEIRGGVFTFALIQALSEQRCATVRQINRYLLQRVPLLSNKYGKPTQKPRLVVDPDERGDLILVPSHAQQRDIELLRSLALDLEAKASPPKEREQLEHALDIWKRINIASKAEHSDFHEAILRITGKLLAISSHPLIETETRCHSAISLKALSPSVSVSSPFGELFGFPELPQHYLIREHQLNRLKSLVLGRIDSVAFTSTRTLGVHGMGGIGKSVLACALAHDDEVRRQFPEGLYWIALGESATEFTILEAQKRIIRFRTGSTASFVSLNEGIKALRAAFRGCACLFVCDDAWKTEHVALFQMLSQASEVLVTTRDASLLSTLDANEYELDILADDEALMLLEDWSGTTAPILADLSSEVAARCGNLPFALAICGAMARDGQSWKDIATALKEADLHLVQHELQGYVYRDVFRCLQAGIRALATDYAGAEERYLELAVFPFDTDVPENAVIRLWGTSGLKEYQTKILLNLMRRKSLMGLETDSFGVPHVRLHDLQYSFCKAVMSDRLPALHKKLLDSYSSNGSPWRSVPNDGYLYDHLVYHLLRSVPDRARDLFTSPEWRDTRFRQSGGDFSGFLSDLTDALEVEFQNARKEITGGQPSTSLLLSIRYLLLRASISSLDLHFPPRLVAYGVQKGVWTSERAIALAQRLTSPEIQSEMMAMLLLPIHSLPQKRQRELFINTLESIAKEQKAEDRAHHLLFVHQFAALNDNQRIEVLSRAFQDASKVGGVEYRFNLMFRVATATTQQTALIERVRSLRELANLMPSKEARLKSLARIDSFEMTLQATSLAQSLPAGEAGGGASSGDEGNPLNKQQNEQ